MTKRFTIALTILLVSLAHSQGESIDQILEKSIKACLDIEAIEYEVYQTAAQGRYGWPELKATIIQQKEDVSNIGFDNALIKAFGTIKEKSVVSPFSFSSDGDVFLYKKGKGTLQKKVNNPTRKTVMGLLQQHLFMLRFPPFTKMKNPFGFNFGGLDNQPFTCEQEEYINDELCYKIIAKLPLIAKNKKNGKNDKKSFITYIWWISTTSYLPIAFSDNFIHKTITIKSINNKKTKHFYANDNNIITKEYTYEQIKEEMYRDYLLKTDTESPSWSYSAKSGKIFSSETLKGKVILLDFWGTWCAPCKKAMPTIEKLHQLYKNNKDVVIIGVSANEKELSASEVYFKEQGYTYLHLANGDKIAEAFKVKIFPTIYIIDKQGQIVHASASFDESVDFVNFNKKIKEHLN